MTVKQLEGRLREILISMGCEKVTAVLTISSNGIRIISVHNPRANSDEEDDEGENYNSMPVKRIGTKFKQQNYMG